MKITHTFIILSFFLTLFCSCTPSSAPENNEYLHKAIAVENWIKDQKIKTADGDIWADEIGKEKVSLSLSSGVSGTALFYLELYNATQNQAYLDEVLWACKYITTKLPRNVTEARAIRNATSLYGDITGSAFILMEVYKLTKDKRWKSSVDHCLLLIDSLSNNPDGRYWNNSSDVLVGSSGIGLFLLYLHQETGDSLPLKIAQEAAEIIAQRAVVDKDSLYWNINQNMKFNLPNFSHGAAGIGYFFAALYEQTQSPPYLETAKKIAAYLDLIAWKADGSFLLPYGLPNEGWEREYDIGWAHGPAGTARFFYKLWQITKETHWLEKVKQCANGIEKSGLPNKPNEHFGENPFPLDMRFGLGSVIDFYINLESKHVLESNKEYLFDLVNMLEEAAIQSDSLTRYWNIKRYGFMGGEKNEPATFTGYFYGSSGLGLLYIRLHKLLNNNSTGIKIPDNPF